MRSISAIRLSEQVHQQLFDGILRGELPPGLRIREGSLARELGVAQGTLREALQQLEHGASSRDQTAVALSSQN